MRNVGAVVAIVIGALLIVAGVVVKWFVTPALAKYPADNETVRIYNGTLDILNREAFETLDLPNLFYQDVDATIERRVETLDATGDEALISDSQVLTAADGAVVLTSESYYVIDRETMEHTSGSELATPDVLPRSGLVVTWPLHTEQRDYAGWSDDPAIQVDVVYEGDEERAGRDTYKFSVSIPPTKIVDEQTLAEFPESVPKAVLSLAGPLLGLTPEAQEQLNAALPALPDEVPLSYTYQTEVEYWVDPTTGILIDIQRHDIRQVALEPAPDQIVPLLPVYDLMFTTSPESVEDASDDASFYGTLLSVGETIVPIATWVLGGLLVIGGIVLYRRSGGADRTDPPEGTAA